MSAHIFIDADNVKPEIGFKAIDKFSEEYDVEQVDIIGNETTLSGRYLEAGNLYNIKNCFYGKNSADTWLCTEIAKTIFEKPEVDTIIIVSSDRDFLAAIKLATDQKRKVIVVSEGNGHRNLKALLYDLRINPDFITLVDFRTELTAEKVKGISRPMKIISPKSDSEKIKDLCKKKLVLPMKMFFVRNESKFRFISIIHAGKSIEVPFFDGINVSTFTNMLIALKIIPNGKTIPKIISDSLLRLDDNKIYQVGKEISEPEKTPFDEVIDYFVEHAAETKNIFVKNNNKIHEVPFVNGISLEMFSKLLEGYEIASGSAKTKKIIADSFLNLRDDRIYFHSEEELSAELDVYLKKIPLETLNFIRQNEEKLKIVSIAYNDKVHKVPFVEGIHLSIFVHMLRCMNVIGKNTSSQKVLMANGFTIRNNLIFKNQ